MTARTTASAAPSKVHHGHGFAADGETKMLPIPMNQRTATSAWDPKSSSGKGNLYCGERAERE